MVAAIVKRQMLEYIDRCWESTPDNTYKSQIMTVESLQDILEKLGLLSSIGYLHGGYPTEEFCLNKTENGWEVYYSERGQKTGCVQFEDESVACNYFLGAVVAAHTHAQHYRHRADSSAKKTAPSWFRKIWDN